MRADQQNARAEQSGPRKRVHDAKVVAEVPGAARGNVGGRQTLEIGDYRSAPVLVGGKRVAQLAGCGIGRRAEIDLA